MKIYIAGKITRLDDYEEKFQAAAERLAGLGHTVMNPAILPPGFEHEEYMHICYAMIDVCDGVYFLNDWKDSKGARMEYRYARRSKRRIMFQQIGGN